MLIIPSKSGIVMRAVDQTRFDYRCFARRYVQSQVLTIIPEPHQTLHCPSMGALSEEG